MTTSPPDADEVQKARSGILNSFIFNSDSRRKILGQQLTYEYFGYPLDWLSRYYDGVQEVTVEAVQEAARKYLHPDKFAILVVGPAEGRDRPLEEYGEVTLVDITIPELEVAQVASTAESQERGMALLDRAVEAVGGADRVASVASLRRSGAAVATAPQGQMQIELDEVTVYPDRMRQEMKLPFGTMVTVVTAEGGFMVTPQGVQEIPESRVADTRKTMRRQLLPLLNARHDEGFEAVAVGADEIDGRPVENVQVSFADDVVTLAIAGDTGEVLAMTYRAAGFSGAPGEIHQRFSDFREVSGLRLPFVTNSTFDGGPYLDMTATEIEIDGTVDEGAFDRPESEQPEAE